MDNAAQCARCIHTWYWVKVQQSQKSQLQLARRSDERLINDDLCSSSCLFCTLTLLHNPATRLLLMSPKGWRPAAGALGERAGRLQTQVEGVQQSSQVALTPGRTYPAARFSARAPLLVPCRLLLTCLSAESSWDFNHSLFPFAWLC